ncbi:hypothetical protein LTR47_003965 [Exophiala xenobiotica]|nr:hypothetical protein LTR47_003965 [Exophiala xenobiotica]KAK5254430.1 hypothetical protein LTS06_001264 [Exophiala xenobiotica]KAK5329618.1 hypothetical protein LTR93_001205 [Exophiala xenobiotica]KAK5372243.1 hypothetical protein LTR11_006365 [Exophiala xenobiotica]KAK5375165.1 hypothetical protein LTS03_005719 [Exophiala xenobiotica]
MTEKIPGPRKLPILGNLLDLWDNESSIIGSLERVADAYGPIYQATLGGSRRIIISSAALMEEMTNEKRFVKVPPKISTGEAARGLFTASNEDPDWAQGHRILMPVFAPLSTQDMFPDMKDIANQLILSWARKGPTNRILVTEDLTRLTLDTIALCTMSYRFNSFYTHGMNPFVEAMMVVFKTNNARATRPAFVNKLMFQQEAERASAFAFMKKVGQDIVENRRANPTDKKDVLNTMIYGKDPKTGEVMRDELIIAQMTTFLIAGHETTSGLLSFAVAQLLKNPHTYLKAQKEIDQAVGNRPIEVDDIKNLKYLNAVLRETARLTPTVPVLQKHVNPDIAHNVVTVDGGRYEIKPDDHIMILLGKAQRDPKVWGETAGDFEPERMLDENFDKVMAAYPGCWKPFGNGKRACIGRPFAWQESMLVLAMILQNFDVQLDDPNYTMKIKQNLTIKPDDFYIRVTPRKNMEAADIDKMIHSKISSVGIGSLPDRTKASENISTSFAPSTARKPMTILYGSNTGTCQAFAQRLASNAVSHGFQAKVADMDSATDSLPRGSPVIIITSSYEGQPPDNAARFIEWLQGCESGSQTGVEYTVFGCGHRKSGDWSQTFHRIPKLTDELLSRFGAKSLATAGFTDAAKGNLQGDFEDWLDTSLWPNLSPGQPNNDENAKAMHVEISTNARASSLRYDVSLAKVQENRLLTSKGEPAKWHMEIELPSNMTYECGDYLAVLPLNSEKSVKRIMAHFGLPWDAVMTVKATGPSIIPADVPLSAFDVLRSYVELSQPATKKNLRMLASYTESTSDKTYLETLANGDENRFETEILAKRTSILDILLRRPSIKLPFGEFLALLPPLHVRQYSISSSPLANNAANMGVGVGVGVGIGAGAGAGAGAASSTCSTCSITYGVIDTTSLSDPGGAHFEGVAGTYLSSLARGDTVQVSVRPTTNKTFRLPLDPETPLLMFAAGTGIAPFRGFMQQRAVMMAANPDRRMGRALLYLGCRGEGDRLYKEEVDGWVESGVADVRYAFSRDKVNDKEKEERSDGRPGRSGGCAAAYVSERMVRDGEARDIVGLWRSGARVYVCGSAGFRDSVREAARQIAVVLSEREDREKGVDRSEEERADLGRRWRQELSERVASDVFD